MMEFCVQQRDDKADDKKKGPVPGDAMAQIAKMIVSLLFGLEASGLKYYLFVSLQ